MPKRILSFYLLLNCLTGDAGCLSFVKAAAKNYVKPIAVVPEIYRGIVHDRSWKAAVGKLLSPRDWLAFYVMHAGLAYYLLAKNQKTLKNEVVLADEYLRRTGLLDFDCTGSKKVALINGFRYDKSDETIIANAATLILGNRLSDKGCQVGILTANTLDELVSSIQGFSAVPEFQNFDALLWMSHGYPGALANVDQVNLTNDFKKLPTLRGFLKKDAKLFLFACLTSRNFKFSKPGDHFIAELGRIFLPDGGTIFSSDELIRTSLSILQELDPDQTVIAGNHLYYEIDDDDPRLHFDPQQYLTHLEKLFLWDIPMSEFQQIDAALFKSPEPMPVRMTEIKPH